jgi:hypothetical protein
MFCLNRKTVRRKELELARRHQLTYLFKVYGLDAGGARAAPVGREPWTIKKNTLS